MPLLILALLMPVALLASTAVSAKDITGASNIPTGIFAESPELCRAYWRNMGPNLEIGLSRIKGKYYYHDCHSNRSCGFHVVSHRRTHTGFVLSLRYNVATGEPTVKLTINRIGNDQFVFTKEGEAPTTRIRCTDADIVAGIGVQSTDDENWDPHFAVYYALDVPGVCPGLVADRDAALGRIGAQYPKNTSDMTKSIVPYDKQNIKDFCRKALDAFGPNGRVIPDLLFAAEAKSPGAPKELIGTFAETAEQCRAWHRNPKALTTISKDEGEYFYSYCEDVSCYSKVLGYRTVPGGFMLNLQRLLAPKAPASQIIIKPVENNAFIFASKDEKPQTMVRCTPEDAIAGIGLQSPVDRPDPDFSARYALSVPKLCPMLAVNEGNARKRLGSLKAEMASSTPSDAECDKKEIKDFCREVLGAFGPNGRVIPDLLHPAGNNR